MKKLFILILCLLVDTQELLVATDTKKHSPHKNANKKKKKAKQAKKLPPAKHNIKPPNTIKKKEPKQQIDQKEIHLGINPTNIKLVPDHDYQAPIVSQKPTSKIHVSLNQTLTIDKPSIKPFAIIGNADQSWTIIIKDRIPLDVPVPKGIFKILQVFYQNFYTFIWVIPQEGFNDPFVTNKNDQLIITFQNTPPSTNHLDFVPQQNRLQETLETIDPSTGQNMLVALTNFPTVQQAGIQDTATDILRTIYGFALIAMNDEDFDDDTKNQKAPTLPNDDLSWFDVKEEKLDQVQNKKRNTYASPGEVIKKSWQHILHGEGIEAMNLLGGIKLTYPTMGHSDNFQHLMGMASIVAGKHNRSARHFEKSTTQESKALISLALPPESSTFGQLTKPYHYTKAYPERMRNRIVYPFMARSFDANKTSVIRTYLTKDLKPKNPQFKVEHEYWLSKCDLKEGVNKSDVPDNLKNLEENRHNRKIAMMAEFDRIKLRIEKKEMDTKVAINRLKRLRLRRYDPKSAFDVDRYLSQILLKQKLYPEAFLLLTQLTKSHSQRSQLEGLQDLMKKEYFNYFKSIAPGKQPLTNIEFYKSYKTLGPTDHKELIVIQQIASDFYKLGVYDTAAEILSKGVHVSDNHTEKNDLWLKIADYRMAEHNFEGARIAMQGIDKSILNKEQESTYFLRLSQISFFDRRFDDAYRFALQVNLPASERIKGDIFWEKKDWNNCKISLEKAIDPKNFDEATFVRLLFCCYHTQDAKKMDDLISKFGSKVKDSRLLAYFKSLSQLGLEPTLQNKNDLQKNIADIDQVLATLRKK